MLATARHIISVSRILFYVYIDRALKVVAPTCGHSPHSCDKGMRCVIIQCLHSLATEDGRELGSVVRFRNLQDIASNHYQR